MNRLHGIQTLRSWPVVLALVLASPLLVAAEPDAAKEPEQLEQDDELQLDEILVEGRKPLRDAQKMLDWMARLVGRFVVEGRVELRDASDSKINRKVQGRADCTGFGPGPAVLCELKIRWPEAVGSDGKVLLGGVSSLNPANMLFGFEANHIGIRYMLVDSNGMAEGALGYLLTGDVLVSRAKCVNVPGQCERRVMITAEPDLKKFEIQIDLEVEFRNAVRFTFVMNRVPGAPSVVMPGTRE